MASYISASLSKGPRPDFLSSPLEFRSHVVPLLDHLYLARPTAVNLGAALDQIRKVLNEGVESNSPVELLAQDVIRTGRAVHEIDLGQNRAMGRWGGDWIVEATKKSGGPGEGLNLLTVCNTGSLATSVSFPSLKSSGKGSVLIAQYRVLVGLRNRAWCHNVLVRNPKTE